MSLDDTIYKIKLALINENVIQNRSEFNSSLGYEENFTIKYESNFSSIHELSSKIRFIDWVLQYPEYFENRSLKWKIIVIILYSLIITVSSFGNFIVCKIVFLNSTMRSRTNICIGNLSVSDILMTIFNVPLQITQILSQNWHLGRFLCKCLPFVQCLSVNVSSFTMAIIALDRYHVIIYPLRPRASMNLVFFKIVIIWGMAAIVSLPYLVLAEVEEDVTYTLLTRCRIIYPEPQYEFRQYLTLVTMFIQYLFPLCITGVTYFRICYILWHRRNIGMMSEKQRHQRYMSKLKTIKMLIIVFLVFAICWCPLNVYHTYQDFRGNVGNNKHNPWLFLICHWLAMSSVCYNPFLYFWLNDKFRKAAKSCVLWFLCIIPNHLEINSRSNVRNKLIRKKVMKRPSKISTFSSSLNSQNTNKTDLMCEDKYPRSEESSSSDTKKIKEFILNDFEMKERIPPNFIKKVFNH